MPTCPTYLECLGGDKLVRCVVQVIVRRLWAGWLGDASGRSPVVKHDRVPRLGEARRNPYTVHFSPRNCLRARYSRLDAHRSVDHPCASTPFQQAAVTVPRRPRGLPLLVLGTACLLNVGLHGTSAALGTQGLEVLVGYKRLKPAIIGVLIIEE